MTGKIMVAVAFGCMLALIIAIIIGANRHITENNNVKTKCKSTTMYAIGNEGRLTKIYECAGVKL